MGPAWGNDKHRDQTTARFDSVSHRVTGNERLGPRPNKATAMPNGTTKTWRTNDATAELLKLRGAEAMVEPVVVNP